MLENYDAELAKERDKSQYRDKGKRTTTIKTVYGEVSYVRRVYQTKLEDGRKAYVYLLDEAMHMDKIGLLSTNLAEKIAMTVTESPYRVTAEIISGTCGQSISHGGAWNLVQRLGERISGEEDRAVKQMEAGKAEGRESLPVLFEEMDGVWLSMQDKGHKKMKKQEMKVFTMYEGWDGSSRQRSRLVNKTMLAGMEKSDEFHRKREALIEKKYNADDIQQRILNGDGGSWIKEPYDPEAIFQLDRFHIYQEIKRKLKEKEAQKAVTELFEAGKIDEMLEYIRIYADSVENSDAADKRSGDAKKLYEYLSNNKAGLLPYQERGIKIPEAKPGIVYKEMGVQENELQGLINDWRNANPHIVRFWYEVGNAAMKAIKEKTTVPLGKLVFAYERGILFIRLPSGRRLSYIKPRIGTNRFGGDSITYMGINSAKKWDRLETFGGKLTENIVQGTARDLLANALINAANAGYDTVFHVHDEIICEVPNGYGSVDELCKLMCIKPEWADGLPLNADGFECEYYKKE